MGSKLSCHTVQDTICIYKDGLVTKKTLGRRSLKCLLTLQSHLRTETISSQKWVCEGSRKSEIERAIMCAWSFWGPNTHEDLEGSSPSTNQHATYYPTTLQTNQTQTHRSPHFMCFFLHRYAYLVGLPGTVLHLPKLVSLDPQRSLFTTNYGFFVLYVWRRTAEFFWTARLANFFFKFSVGSNLRFRWKLKNVVCTFLSWPNRKRLHFYNTAIDLLLLEIIFVIISFVVQIIQWFLVYSKYLDIINFFWYRRGFTCSSKKKGTIYSLVPFPKNEESVIPEFLWESGTHYKVQITFFNVSINFEGAILKILIPKTQFLSLEGDTSFFIFVFLGSFLLWWVFDLSFWSLDVRFEFLNIFLKTCHLIKISKLQGSILKETAYYFLVLKTLRFQQHFCETLRILPLIFFAYI